MAKRLKFKYDRNCTECNCPFGTNFRQKITCCIKCSNLRHDRKLKENHKKRLLISNKNKVLINS